MHTNSLLNLQSLLSVLPDELLLWVFKLIDAEELLAVSVTSRRLRKLALDNTLWRSFCARILEICSNVPESGNDSANELSLSTWGAKSYFQLYLGFRRWEPYLGWWIPTKTGAPLRFSLDAHTARIVKSEVLIMQDFDDELPLVRGSRMLRFNWGIHIVVEPIDGDSMTIAVQDIKCRFLQRKSLDWRAASSQMAGRVLPPSADHWETWSVYKPKDLSRMCRIFPTPSVYTAVRGAEISTDGDLICASYLDRARHLAYAPIHPPDSPHWKRDSRNPLDSGLYVASYGAHGPEMVCVSFRALTQQDFEWNNDSRSDTPGLWWPWDFHLSDSDPAHHLGPFGRNAWGTHHHRCGEIMASDLRPGLRIMEVTKLTGDPNVPHGQRSVIAFLDIPKPTVTSADMSRTNQAISETDDGPIPSYAVLPQQSKRPTVAPWPMLLYNNEPVVPARIMSTHEMMSSGAGWVVHGIGRTSESGFRRPGWSPSVIHFASRQEFQVLWLGMVMTFNRLDRYDS